MLETYELLSRGILDFLILFALGGLGWALFSWLRAPVPPLLGTLLVIGVLRVLEMPIPDAPRYLAPVVQVFLGLYIGSKVNRDTVRELKSLLVPAVVISTWALTVIFLVGWLLSRLTWLDGFTAVLSSSIGGLPEMMVLSVATGADLAVVIVMQTFRMLATVAIFPLIYHKWFVPDGQHHQAQQPVNSRRAETKSAARELYAYFAHRPHILLFSLLVALAGGWLLSSLGVPAGIMVGSMLAVAAAGVAGLPMRSLHPRLFSPLLVTVGIMVSDNFGPETAQTLLSGRLLWPVIISTCVIFASSLGIAWIIHRLSGWDMPTSFLAAAPGGFTVMTTLAIRYNKDPFKVSMLHLCRLMAIKTVVPLVFMFFI